MKTESLAMRIFRNLKMERIAWALRRLHCPVREEALVLEIGSGGNPYPRANVLLDAYEMTRERHWVPLKADRPMVLGFAEKLPFKDHAFDFAIASHVLEHSSDPRRFLSELQRVAKAGYIETPDAFMERINPYKDHRLEITCRKSGLMIKKKPSWIVEQDTVELYENEVKPFLTRQFIPKHPFAFHLRYYWEDKIDFTVINPEVNAAWAAIPDEGTAVPATRDSFHGLRGLFLNLLRSLLSQQNRNKKINLPDLLICPTCASASLSWKHDIVCEKCGISYPINNGIPAMYPTVPTEDT